MASKATPKRKSPLKEKESAGRFVATKGRQKILNIVLRTILNTMMKYMPITILFPATATICIVYHFNHVQIDP
jgi:hypothetical protein